MTDTPASLPARDTDRTLWINSLLVEAFMVREGFKPGPPPDVAVFSVADAIAASEAMARDPNLGATRNANGTTTLTCHVEPSRVSALYDWARSEKLGRGIANG